MNQIESIHVESDKWSNFKMCQRLWLQSSLVAVEFFPNLSVCLLLFPTYLQKAVL